MSGFRKMTMSAAAWLVAAVLGTYAAYGLVMIRLHPAFLYPFAAEEAWVEGFARAEVPVAGADPVGVLVGGPPDGPPVLFFMGNAGALGLFEPWLTLHSHAGRRVVAMEYRGGGGLAGQPSEARLKADALAVHDWVAGQGGPVTVHGFSLGAGLAVHVAARRPVAAAILEAPFSSACRMMARAALLPACLMPVQRWDSAAEAGALAAPVLVIHGDADEVIPIGEGRRLARAVEAAGGDVRFEAVPAGHHGDLPSFPAYRAAVARFLGAQAP
jgi:pimeloyl-ACP methyl ester carboxylesterase